MFVTPKNFQNTYFEPDARFNFFFLIKKKERGKKRSWDRVFFVLFFYTYHCYNPLVLSL